MPANDEDEGREERKRATLHRGCGQFHRVGSDAEAFVRATGLATSSGDSMMRTFCPSFR